MNRTSDGNCYRKHWSWIKTATSQQTRRIRANISEEEDSDEEDDTAELLRELEQIGR